MQNAINKLIKKKNFSNLKYCKVCNKVFSTTYNKILFCSKECVKLMHNVRNSKYRLKNKEICIERTIKSQKKNKNNYRSYQNTYKRNHRLEESARDKVYKFKNKNINCFICKNKLNVEHHHIDYNYPLMTIPLCNKHHINFHTELNRFIKLVKFRLSITANENK